MIKDNLPQGRWKVGKIAELIKRRDQSVRAAKVLVEPGKVLQRVLNFFTPLNALKVQLRHYQIKINKHNKSMGFSGD